MKFSSLFRFIIALLPILIIGCEDKTANMNKNITIEAFSDMKMSQYAVNSHKIRAKLDDIAYHDVDSTVADIRTKSYYLNRNPFLWIDRHGVDNRADTLLQFLNRVDEIGFTKRSFCVRKIKRDLERIRNLEFDDSINSINNVLARLEYRLTKAYLRYATGQRFGYVNPNYIFNRIDVLDKDSNGTRYRKLFDIDMQHPGKKFFNIALRQIYADSISTFLKQVQPHDSYFYELQSKLIHDNLSAEERLKVLCNMERCRWRLLQYPPKGGKYVLVNIPAFKLFTVDGQNTQDMLIGCGAIKTKTPLLSSFIERMDVNPKWNLPMSIVKKDIVRHAGNKGYFDRKNMFVTYKKTGERINPSFVSASMLLSGEYRVSQEGGKGNSLGRIIFRFPNNFSVYLHDTSSKDVFGLDYRGVSHGCVRVEHPFDLAKFLLGDHNQQLLEQIYSAMGLNDESLSQDEDFDKQNTHVHTRAVNINPKIPLFITYFTLYHDASGTIQSYPDVYGYDDLIARGIKPFMK